MNSKQRRRLRRKMEREISRVSPNERPPERPLAWPMVLLCRASRSHCTSISRTTNGSRTDRHLFKVLDDRRFSIHGIRHRPAAEVFPDPLVAMLGTIDSDLPVFGDEGSIGGVTVKRCPGCSVWLIPGQSCGHENLHPGQERP